jgi:hypothetical protein
MTNSIGSRAEFLRRQNNPNPRHFRRSPRNSIRTPVSALGTKSAQNYGLLHLTILEQPGQEDFAQFLASEGT